MGQVISACSDQKTSNGSTNKSRDIFVPVKETHTALTSHFSEPDTKKQAILNFAPSDIQNIAPTGSFDTENTEDMTDTEENISEIIAPGNLAANEEVTNRKNKKNAQKRKRQKKKDASKKVSKTASKALRTKKHKTPKKKRKTYAQALLE